jgi:hypothetical protein
MPYSHKPVREGFWIVGDITLRVPQGGDRQYAGELAEELSEEMNRLSQVFQERLTRGRLFQQEANAAFCDHLSRPKRRRIDNEDDIEKRAACIRFQRSVQI